MLLFWLISITTLFIISFIIWKNVQYRKEKQAKKRELNARLNNCLKKDRIDAKKYS